MDVIKNFEKNLLITSSNQKKNVHYINLLKLVPKMKQEKKFRYKRQIFKSRNINFIYNQKSENESKNENNKKINVDKITQINMSALNELYSETTPFQRNNINLITHDKKSISLTSKNINKTCDQNNYRELIKDPVFAYFNRNFYENDIPISKKIELNQKVLNYYLQDKEKKEKYQRLKFENIMSKKNRFINLNDILNIEKKSDIKKSLILDDYSIYNKIHKILRFWGKFSNYACPIFQVQKSSLDREKPKKDKLNFLFENDFLQKNFSEKQYRLPVLYTNSTRTINKFGNKKYKFMNKNKSHLDINVYNSFNQRLLNINK